MKTARKGSVILTDCFSVITMIFRKHPFRYILWNKMKRIANTL